MAWGLGLAELPRPARCGWSICSGWPRSTSATGGGAGARTPLALADICAAFVAMLVLFYMCNAVSWMVYYFVSSPLHRLGSD